MTELTELTEPIHTCIDRWHQHLRGDLPGGLDAILHPEVIFLSPVVYTPQVGIEITKLYLAAAGATIGGGDPAPQAAEERSESGFGYTKKILSGNQAMLEFETTMQGKYVNGVDIITCDDDSMITEFRVMLRPLQAVNIVHEQMKAMLETLNP